MKKNETYKDSKSASKAIDATFADHENITIDCEDKEKDLRVCMVSSDKLKQKTTKPPIKKMTINDLATIVIQGFAEQKEFNSWVYDAITVLQRDVKRIDGVLEKNNIK
ncbi:hypothetical protein CJJ23_04715 [Mycoplasmopsis agassizii]|uniref:Uncharacterized protein n=1 Tax=Mycoplasmopsis agassizii TaxID=33922 RepID=A0A269THQ9_9BACT|nr:hypothetical protein [Mycoplasmopsis agassizii]PAK20927.1 hypothetical protein CJJ23_04715 [Mycoplasmopsis agassizii]